MIGDLLRRLGAAGVDAALAAGDAVILLGTAIRRVFNPRHPGREFRAAVRQMYAHGVLAIPVVLLVAVFMGMIVSLQTGVALRDYGQEDLIGSVVATSMFREMGPFITAIILAATAGSACAAEIGTMKVSEEIDALHMMSIDPVRFLVVPRIAALAVMCVVLTLVTDVCGTAGGALVARSQLGVPFDTYMDAARASLGDDHVLGFLAKDVYTGLVKAFVFGVLIGTVGCAEGLRTSGGALGVGRAVRAAVVASIVLVLVLGYYMTALFYGA